MSIVIYNTSESFQLNQTVHRCADAASQFLASLEMEPSIYANSRRQRESNNVSSPISNPANNGAASIPRDNRNFSLLTAQLALFTTVGIPKLIVHETPSVKEIGKWRLTRS